MQHKKPKLIVLNGPVAIGKSTIAKMYVNDHPLSLNLDIDEVRKLISEWEKYSDKSAHLVKTMAAEMAGTMLRFGHDVIIPQIYRKTEYLDQLRGLALQYGARYYEIALLVDKQEARQRFIKRGQQLGYLDGIKPHGLLEAKGGLDYLESMFDEMLAVINTRPETIKLHPVFGQPEATYKELLSKLS